MFKTIPALAVVSSVSLVSMVASAALYGVVKVECWGDCNRVDLGQICDAFQPESNPISVSCDDTADPGSGTRVTCGNGATCTPWSDVRRSDPLGAYCADGAGNDAVVACLAP